MTLTGPEPGVGSTWTALWLSGMHVPRAEHDRSRLRMEDRPVQAVGVSDFFFFFFFSPVAVGAD